MPEAVVGAVVGNVVGGLFGDDGGGGGGGGGSSAANDAAAQASRLQAQIAKEQWDKYKEIYDPLERQMVTEAQNYDSPEQYARAAGEASATVSSQFSKARDRLTRTPGLDPSSAGYAANMVGLNLAQAASDATQQNLARKNVADTAYSRKQSALGLGKGLDTTASSGAASAATNNLALANALRRNEDASAASAGNLAGQLWRGARNLWNSNGGWGGLDFGGGGGGGSGGGSSFNYATDTPTDLSGTEFI